MFRNLFHRLRIGPPHRALLCHDLFHTSSRASYPRGKPRSQEDANRERGDTVANWENYLQGSDAHLEPLERRVMIRSGMIRMDSANQPKVDGEEDLFIRANEENKPTLIPGHHRKDRSLQPHVSVASKPEHGKIEDAKGTLEYFFETPETRDNLVGSIKTFGSSRSAQTLAYPSEFPSDNNLRSETFSYEPGKASFRFNPVLDAESPTMNPVGQDQGFIEDQYFSQSLSSSTAQTPEQPQNLRSSDGSISNSDLNTFDEQYFSTDISDPVSMPIAGLDLERVQQLVRDSTREMNLIDEQLFGQISDQDTLKPYEAHDPDPAESRPETEGEKNRREKYEMIQKCKERRERKKLTRDPLPQVSGALAYVQKLRREAKTAANTATKTKEDFVDEINIGIQRRLTMAAGITDVEETINENETKRALKNQMKREGSLPPEPIPATQVKDSFKPEDFSKFSPVEIEEILANRVVLNDCKYNCRQSL